MNLTTELQRKVMAYISTYIRIEKTTVPKQMVILTMRDEGIKDSTILATLDSLLKKGYIKRAAFPTRNTSYIQLRGFNL